MAGMTSLGLPDEKSRVRMGIQCPECFGVNTGKRAEASKFQCLDCGCQWDRNYYPERR